MTIVHQQQPTPYTCNQACLAMLLNEPVEKVVAAFPAQGMTQRELFAALDTCGFEWNAFMFGKLVCEGFYLAAVPSLNFEGSAHTVLFESRQRLIVYDPNRGREGKKFYSEDGDGVPLRFWTELVYVLPGGRLPESKS